MFSLTEQQQQTLETIAHIYAIDLLVLFGSRAIGRHHPRSDFDIAYRSYPQLSLEQEARLIIDLSSVFKSGRIDLVNIITAPPLLRYVIFKDGVLLYEKHAAAFASHAAYSFKSYIEAKPLFDYQLHYLKKNNQESYGV